MMPAPKNIPYSTFSAVDDAGAEEHPVLDLLAPTRRDPQYAARHQVLLEAAGVDGVQESREPLGGVALGAHVERGHVGAAAAQRGHHGDARQVRVRQHLGEGELERSVAAVEHQEIELLMGELREGLRQDVGVIGLDVENVGMAPQELEDARDLGPAAARAQVVQHTDSHVWFLRDPAGARMLDSMLEGFEKVERHDAGAVKRKSGATFAWLECDVHCRVDPGSMGTRAEEVQHPDRSR
jgi:hypothetical protein